MKLLKAYQCSKGQSLTLWNLNSSTKAAELHCNKYVVCTVLFRAIVVHSDLKPFKESVDIDVYVSARLCVFFLTVCCGGIACCVFVVLHGMDRIWDDVLKRSFYPFPLGRLRN